MDNYYKSVAEILTQYLGPAAPRFIDRQLSFHLNRTEPKIQKSELPKVSEWIRVGLGLVTQDKKLVKECMDQLEKIA